MKLFNLGTVPNFDSMVSFHALARMGIESLVVVSPKTPYVSVGYFQDTARVLDVDRCRALNLPIIRREVGGGCVLLDENQVFYHVILRKDNPILPRTIDGIYRKFSQPPINTYAHFGVKVHFKPVNDLVTPEGKKIAGEGGANIGDCMVFVGSIIMDFNVKMMAQILRLPDEKFRDKVYKTMENSISSLKEELGQTPRREEVEEVLVEEFRKILGPLEESSLTPEIKSQMQLVEKELTAENFLFDERFQRHEAITIKAGSYIGYGNYKAKGGLISTTVTLNDDRIEAASISGDFTLNPKEAITLLERCLDGVAPCQEAVHRAFRRVIEANHLSIPGVDAEDLSRAVMDAIG